jgi:hypothetical protein
MEPIQLALMRIKFESLCHDLGYNVERDPKHPDLYRVHEIRNMWRFFLDGGTSCMETLDQLKGVKL